MAELVWRSYKGFAEALYAYVDFHASEKPAFLNRHYILHGRGIADSNLTDCLRLPQALHTLTALA